MDTIELSDEYAHAVISGTKTSTIRLGRRHYKLGEAVLRTTGRDIDVIIQRVCYCRLQDLSEEDALKDGFSCRRELISALRTFYPSLSDKDELTIVEFTVL